MSRTKGATDKKPRQKRTDDHKPYEKSPIYQGQKAEMPEGYNAKLVQFIIDITPKEPLDYNDVEEMERRFFRYLEKCVEYDMKVSNQSAYTAIGIDKGLAWEWTNRSAHMNKARFDFVKKVQKVCSTYRENLMQDGKVNPVIGIFWQKNYDGLKDQQEVVLTPNNPLGDTEDSKALKDKYLENTYGVTPEIAESSAETLKIEQKAAEGAESTDIDRLAVTTSKS